MLENKDQFSELVDYLSSPIAANRKGVEVEGIDAQKGVVFVKIPLMVNDKIKIALLLPASLSIATALSILEKALVPGVFDESSWKLIAFLVVGIMAWILFSIFFYLTSPAAPRFLRSSRMIFLDEYGRIDCARSNIPTEWAAPFNLCVDSPVKIWR